MIGFDMKNFSDQMWRHFLFSMVDSALMRRFLRDARTHNHRKHFPELPAPAAAPRRRKGIAKAMKRRDDQRSDHGAQEPPAWPSTPKLRRTDRRKTINSDNTTTKTTRATPQTTRHGPLGESRTRSQRRTTSDRTSALKPSAAPAHNSKQNTVAARPRTITEYFPKDRLRDAIDLCSANALRADKKSGEAPDSPPPLPPRGLGWNPDEDIWASTRNTCEDDSAAEVQSANMVGEMFGIDDGEEKNEEGWEYAVAEKDDEDQCADGDSGVDNEESERQTQCQHQRQERGRGVAVVSRFFAPRAAAT
ncbi:hypothetical protein HDU82_008837 [Entophlyctis luteolus]|nr:hypothetical protein HDU82_008837 [Entophlyctis luteolus]